MTRELSDLSQRRVLVTGASSGIGEATAAALLERGAAVVGMARDFSRSRIDVERFQRIEVDLADLDALATRLSGDLAAVVGDVDTAVLNAGRGQFGNLEEFSTSDIRSLVDLNFTAHALVARALVPQLKRRGRGDVIFIGSEAALAGKRRGAVYCATKFAVRGFAQALREECGRSGVRVCVIHPGLTRTPFYDALDFAPGSDAANFVEPADVAAAIIGVLETRAETVLDEIILSPLKNVVEAKDRRRNPRRS